MLLYPVYTLLFSDTGLSVWQISSLFVIWSVSSLVLEVPSGAWADATSRRRLLILGPLLTAVAFALWVAAPAYWVFALGFVLWGLKSALTSGALEALVYEELQRVEATRPVRHPDGPRSGGGRAGRDVFGCGRGTGDLGRWFCGGRSGQCRRLCAGIARRNAVPGEPDSTATTSPISAGRTRWPLVCERRGGHIRCGLR